MQVSESELTADELIVSRAADCSFVEPVSRAPVGVLLTSAPFEWDFPWALLHRCPKISSGYDSFFEN